MSHQIERIEIQTDGRVSPRCSDTPPSQHSVSPGKMLLDSNSGSEEHQTKATGRLTSTARHNHLRHFGLGSNDIVVTTRQDNSGKSPGPSQTPRTSTSRRRESAPLLPSLTFHTDRGIRSSETASRSTGVKSGTAMQPPVTPSPQQPESVSLTDAQSIERARRSIRPGGHQSQSKSFTLRRSSSDMSMGGARDERAPSEQRERGRGAEEASQERSRRGLSRARSKSRSSRRASVKKEEEDFMRAAMEGEAAKVTMIVISTFFDSKHIHVLCLSVSRAHAVSYAP